MAKRAVTRELVGMVVCSSYVTHQKVISYSATFSCTLLQSHTGNSRRSHPSRRWVTNRSQSITGQSGVGRKCITLLGPWFWFWGPSLYRQTYEWCARVTSSQVCRGAVASRSLLLLGQLHTLCLLVCQSLPDIEVKGLKTAHESKKFRIFHLVNRS